MADEKIYSVNFCFRGASISPLFETKEKAEEVMQVASKVMVDSGGLRFEALGGRKYMVSTRDLLYVFMDEHDKYTLTTYRLKCMTKSPTTENDYGIEVFQYRRS